MGGGEVEEMSRGQAQTRTQSGKRILERCKEKEGIKDTIFIDVDNDKFDHIIIIDIPESSQKRTQGSSASLEHKKYPSNNIISIDDDDESSDNEKNGPSDGGLDLDSDATSSKASSSASSQTPNSEESNCDECQFIQEKNFPVKLSKCRRTYSEKAFSRNHIGSSPVSGSSSSESDSSDCELMECSSGKIREQWERASVRKKTFLYVRSGYSGFKDQATASGGFTDAAKNIGVDNLTKHVEQPFCSTSSKENDEKQNLSASTDANDGISVDPYFNREEHDHVEELHENVDQDNSWSTTQMKEELQFLHKIFNMQDRGKKFSGQYSFDENELQNDGSVNQGKTILRDKEKVIREPSLTSSRERIDLQFSSGKDHFQDRRTNVSAEPSCLRTHRKSCSKFGEELPQSQVESIHLLNAGDGDEKHNIQISIIGEREKLKQTEEYKRAEEEEWASRQRQLQIQAEEAQRMRKRKKAEALRLLDMERRQKERLEEMRETHKKNVETINLKEHLRSKVRKELDKLEVMHNDMASLLRCLGIHVGGGPCPTSHEVNAAYKQALLRFHPDRASRTDIQQQVEAEEKFKLVSRLKEKLVPSS